MEAAKKQRNPRSQKNRRKEKDTEPQDNTVLVEDIKGSDPQPQRANRRQRNEPTPSTTNIVTPAPAVEDKKENAEIVIDHSNLKRETEEIAKLKKKFTKREITSNWHRYEAPEAVKNIEETDAENGPADFSVLLQVPLSRGGHLQLKEEKDWSNASGAEPSGYFALDLKQLSLSLACVPLHEQLLLPKRLLTEEEIKHFDALANQAKACYERFIEETPNLKVDVNKETFNILDIERSSPNLKVDINKETFNILDIERSNEILLNISNEPKQFSHSLNNDGIGILNSNKLVNLNLPSETRLIEERQKEPENKENTTDLKIDQIIQTETLNAIKNNVDNATIKHSPERQLIINKGVPINESKENYTKPYEKIPTENIERPNECTIAEIASTQKELIEKNIVHGDINISDKNTSESKEKRAPRNSSKKLPTNELNKPITTIKKTSQPEKAKVINMEEDDDLDFLLSLKNPVPSQTKKESKPTNIQDSSFLPGGTVVSQPTSKEQHSELDDWLDSVLQD